ncbi:MAG: nickel pincer cofactor biosynthesis protein LarC [Syntrophales bacterium]|nr:nickel pincer cofactor biosynthesis protein LarC [Syntrophales bacterium]
MKILIFDPVGGASGDMILGSLLHLGCPVSTLTEAWDALDILDRPAARTLELDWKLVQGIRARDVTFSLPASPAAAGRRRGRARAPAATDRTWREIRAMLERAALPADVRETSLRIFASLAEAEATVHGVAVDQVHFHEVGAVDSILDITGIAAAVAWFRAEAVYATSVPVGQGTVVCRHGRLPLPAPATVALLEGLPVRFTKVAGELTTPTGAAVLKALTSGAPPPAEIILRGVGYGCGDRTYDDWPSLFRTLLADTAPAAPEAVYVLEADVDDLSPEDWELATARLYAAGALDVTLTARIMKRGRPGVGLTVLVPDTRLHDVADLVLEETSTIGVRYHPVARRVLPRRTYPFRTPHGELRIKEVVTPAGIRRCKPEYADLQALAVSANRPLVELRREVQAMLQDLSRPAAPPSAPGPAPEPPAGEAPVPKKKPARRAAHPAKAAGRTRKKEPA